MVYFCRDEFPFRQQNLALSKFRRFATEKNVHVTLVIHPRKVRINQSGHTCIHLKITCMKNKHTKKMIIFNND